MNRLTAIRFGILQIQEAIALRDFEGARDTLRLFANTYPETHHWVDLRESLEAVEKIKFLRVPKGSLRE